MIRVANAGQCSTQKSEKFFCKGTRITAKIWEVYIPCGQLYKYRCMSPLMKQNIDVCLPPPPHETKYRCVSPPPPPPHETKYLGGDTHRYFVS